ncbi:RDD family protein [Paenibacillus agaridevorans]|uniref:RDD family protein n=1 Tax=Paenibacillus agaridevorans TaxID=171404 RepID=A0A2R5F2H9_9BACL|nr:RDD family protein [Paenibacillus agaridevorans]GBG12369.1 RDD family protein [Paenibacillus agaridevorans]
MEQELVQEPAPLAPQQPTKPWIRFWARYFDYLSHAILISILWILIDFDSFLQINDNLLGFILLVAFVFLDALYMYFWGTTPGKKLLNIKVLDADGTRMPKSLAFKRARLVWLRGMGLGVGILEIIANIVGYRRLKKEGITSWDQELGLQVIHGKIGIFRMLLTPFIVVLLLGIAVYGMI